MGLLKRFWQRCFHKHVWISDLPLSLDGCFAILAGLWMPPASCECGAKYAGCNKPREEWIDEKNGARERIRLDSEYGVTRAHS